MHRHLSDVLILSPLGKHSPVEPQDQVSVLHLSRSLHKIVMVAGLTDLPTSGVDVSLYELTSLFFASVVAFFKVHLLYFRRRVCEEGQWKALA